MECIFHLFLCLLQDFIERAESYNKRGKVEFQEGRFENACQQYTFALECLPSDKEKDLKCKYHRNRAGCYVKLVCRFLNIIIVNFFFVMTYKIITIIIVN